MTPLATARRLGSAGVLGLNRRNADYISLHNQRRLYPRVDDKLLTKELALAAGMAVPELYTVVAAQHEIEELPDRLAGRDSFVVKPAQGSGGNGILVITGVRGRRYRKSSGSWIDAEALGYHVSNGISGLYSLGGHRDRVLIEYCVRFDPLFEEVAYQGVPDIRVIVFRGFPVMAMVRLPTGASDGKANLHQGAIGVGVDLASGVTVEGVQGTTPIAFHPDTERPIAGLAIPSWEAVLEQAARCCEITGLGYLGVDFVLDRDLGPLILEMNARPGLNIQIANRRGLLGRLRAVDALDAAPASAAERVAWARRRFAHEPAGGTG